MRWNVKRFETILVFVKKLKFTCVFFEPNEMLPK